MRVAQTGTPRTKFLVPSIGSTTHWRWLWPVEPCSSPRTASRDRTRDSVRRMACSTAWSASVTGVRSGLLITCRSSALKRLSVIESASSASTWARRRSSVKSTEPDAGPEIGMTPTLFVTEPNSRSIRTMRRDCLRGPSPVLGNVLGGCRPPTPCPGDPRRRGVRPAGRAQRARVRRSAAISRPAPVADHGPGGDRRRGDLGGLPLGTELLRQRPVRQLRPASSSTTSRPTSRTQRRCGGSPPASASSRSPPPTSMTVREPASWS